MLKRAVCVFQLLIQQKHDGLSLQWQIMCVWIRSQEIWAHSEYANKSTDNQLRWKLFKQLFKPQGRDMLQLEKHKESKKWESESHSMKIFWQCMSLHSTLDYNGNTLKHNDK